MGFFDRNRAELASRGVDPKRLPPGQYSTDRFPVLHTGEVPSYGDLTKWQFRVFGAVGTPLSFSFSDLVELPSKEVEVDIHCVTKWSKFGTRWKGVPFSKILELSRPDDDVTHIMCHAEHGYSSNVPLKDVSGEHEALLAYEYDGAPLEPEHGFPLRFLVPHLYFWKSAKWLRGVEFMTEDRPGFWERNGYNIYGDPWREQRYWNDK